MVCCDVEEFGGKVFWEGRREGGGRREGAGDWGVFQGVRQKY